MPATATHIYTEGEEEVEKKGTVLESQWFNITFTLGKLHFVVVRRV